MKEVKYAVYPGPIRSKNDGQIHHVPADKLMLLYGVEPAECLIVWPRYYGDPSAKSLIERADKLIPLFPRYNGDYILPTC